jgi:integrase
MGFSQTETCWALSSAKGFRVHPSQRSRSRSPASRAIRSSSAGESVKAVSEYLGHSDPAMTLRVYAHLMPSSRERARRALDDVFGEDQTP